MVTPSFACYLCWWNANCSEEFILDELFKEYKLRDKGYDCTKEDFKYEDSQDRHSNQLLFFTK